MGPRCPQERPQDQIAFVNHLIDTNLLIYAIQKQPGTVFQNFLFQLASRGLSFISVISRFELLAGSTEIHRGKNVAFLNSFPCLNITASIADRAGFLFFEYRKKGVTFDNEDVLLSATALEEGLALVTTNGKHFPSFRPLEKHHLSFQTRKGGFETKEVFILTH